MIESLIRLILRLLRREQEPEPKPEPKPPKPPMRWSNWGQEDVTFQQLDALRFRDLD